MKSVRNHQAYWAFLGHRLSGLALALFLPCILRAGHGAGRGPLRPLPEAVRHAGDEGRRMGLVLLLALHLCFGLRLLALELLPWRSTRNARNGWIGWGLAVSMGIGLVFIAGVI